MALILGFVVGNITGSRTPAEPGSSIAADSNQAAGPAGAMVDAERIPVGDSPVLGNPNALVTIVEFSDYQCPFCSRVEDTMRQIRQQYGNDVRLVWKDAPLPFHDRAMPAAIAAREVFSQGGNAKFWAYHDLLYQNQQNLDNATLERLAQQVGGINMDRFRAALSGNTHQARVQQDQQLAQRLNASGTPNFFINGTNLVGAQPFDRFKTLIDQVLARARTIQPRNRVYAEMVANPVAGAEPTPSPSQPQQPQRQEDPNAVYAVPVGNSPFQGPRDALVTMVVFSDFQCPFCSRVEATVREMRQRYGNDLRVVWKHEPLPFHNRARPAAALAQEAFAQGSHAKFWQVHDILMENQQHLEDADLERYAQQAGLNMARYRAAVAANTHNAAIDADHALAQRVEANGTPHFFINGRRLVGAQPASAFQTAIDDAKRRAEELIRTRPGTTRANVYERIIENGATGTVYLPGGNAPSPAAAAPAEPDADRVYQVRDNPRAPALGPANARVVIQHFSDFQCPFCSRVLPTVDQIMERYRGRVRFVWRDYPLPFHNNAMPAAEAGREVLAQRGADAFWRYHHLMFQNSSNLDRATLERLAGEIGGVNMDRFRAALDNHTHQAAVREDVAAADATGAQIGTPAFFINGKFVAGALPFEEFQRRIDAALAAPAR
ncbi:MAG: thioredoxin domain-containing protein [Polyangiales bacterium]